MKKDCSATNREGWFGRELINGAGRERIVGLGHFEFRLSTGAG